MNVQTLVENCLIPPVIEDNAPLGTTLSFPPMFAAVPRKRGGFVR
jgi:hypothetical protein